MKLFLSLAALISVSFFGAEAGPACSMNQATIMQDVTICMEHSPSLAIMIATHMNNPSSLESADFLCRFKSDIAELFVCLENKLTDCLPAQKQLLMAVLPTKAGLLDGFNYLCEHKSVVNSNCFDGQMNTFMQCYMTNLQQLSTAALHNVKDPHQIMCNVIRAEEKCFAMNKGTCSDEFIRIVVQALEKVFSMKQCPKNQAIKQLTDSLLLRGQPLHFQPLNPNGGYVIKN